MVGDVDFEYDINVEWDDIRTYLVQMMMQEHVWMLLTFTSIVYNKVTVIGQC